MKLRRLRDGDVLKDGDVALARGGEGADRIDLVHRVRAVLALDANGLRVLARLGFSDPVRSYAISYRRAQIAAIEQLPRDSASLPARLPAPAPSRTGRLPTQRAVLFGLSYQRRLSQRRPPTTLY